MAPGSRRAASMALGMLSLTSFLLGAADAWAQQKQDVSVAEATLEEVVVTSRKVSENVQDVPLTVNVLTAEALTERGIVNLSQINGVASNVVWEDLSSTTRNRITIRGIASNDNSASFDPGIGVYVDDVYLASGLSFNSGLLDVDRIEILKGPQGTLFGRNTTAGAISITTRRPSLSEHYAEGAADFGNYDLRQYRGIINAPLAATVAAKLSGVYRKREGYSDNIVTGKRDVNDENYHGSRMQLLFNPSESLQVLASADWFNDQAAQGLAACAGPGLLGDICLAQTLDDILSRKIEANPPNDTRREMWGASVITTWAPADRYTLTSITAYRHLRAVEHQDQDSTRLDIVRSGGFGVPAQWQVSQELRLATPQENRLRAVTGLYYLREKKDIDIPIEVTAFGLELVGVPATTAGEAHTIAMMETDSYAAYGQASYDVTADLTAELGLRYTHDGKRFRYQQQVDDILVGIPGIPVRVAPLAAEESWGAVSGTTSLSWHLAQNAMPYLRYSRGYKSGGFNAATAVPDLQIERPYDPEYLDSLEAGLKFESSSRLFRINLAVFAIKYTDLQFRIENELRQVFIDNAGEAESHGAEVELSYVPLPGLMIDANAGIQRAEYTRFTATNLLPLSDKELAHAPHATASATATYEWPLSGSLVGLISGTAIYRSDAWLDQANTIESPSYVMLNARLGVEDSRGKWGIFLYSNNLTDVDRVVFAEGPSFTAARFGYVNPPRTYGIQLRAGF